jgi:DNA primase
LSLYSSDSLERVRQAADIVEIVSAHTDLRRQGDRFVGLCPFHEERTPSFSVNAHEKLYYCFGCEAGGDVFRFVQEKEGIGFGEAVETLAERYGVELRREKEDPQAEARRRNRERMRELLERTATFYKSFLWESEQAAKAREYLAERGLGEEVLRDFDVGFAPSAWDQVLTRGQRAGFSVDELRSVGLAQRNRQGGVYDRFRARIMFPVRDQRGRVLGFGARALRPDQKPKYLNSPEGELYKKSKTLFGIDRARAPIAKAGRAIVVEGYTDVLALHQAGVSEAVAVMGTAITVEQVEMLSGQVEEVVLAMDADRSGQEAMLRAQRVAKARTMRIRVAAMSAGEDPADMLAAGSANRFNELVEGAVDLPVFQVGLVLAATDTGSASERDRALAEVAPVLAEMGETASRDEQVRKVAERLDMEPSMVVGRVVASRRSAEARPGDSDGSEGVAAPAGEALTPRERRERALMAMCIAAPKDGQGYLQRLSSEHLSSPVTGRALEWLRGHLEDPLSGLPREDEDLVALVTQLKMTAEREPASPEAMELNFLQLEQRRLEERIEAADEKGDYAEKMQLSGEREALGKRIRQAEQVAG